MILAAVFVRFWRLGFKPLWLDEIITILVALGRTPVDVPTGTAIPLDTIAEIFRMKAGASWAAVVGILQDRSVEHTHPPLFYLVLHTWLGWTTPQLNQLAWAARAPAGVFGVGGVVALYGLGRRAFSRDTGLLAAALCAVSPLVVALSLEARNYTLPLFFVALALWAVLAIGKEFGARGKVPGRYWAVWAALNTLAIYGHYYSAIAFTSQIAVLGWLFWRTPMLTAQNGASRWRAVAGLSIAAGFVALAFLPWVPTLLWHIRTPELGWIDRDSVLPGLIPLLRAPLQMVVAARVETRSFGIFAGWGLGSIGVGCWLIWVTVRGIRRLLASIHTRSSTGILLGFLTAGALQFLLFGTVMHKNLLLQPRYHFVYYPAVCALIAASLSEAHGLRGRPYPSTTGPVARRVRIALALAAGLVSSLLIGADYAMPKPFRPRDVATGIIQASAGPLLVVVGENTFHEVCVGLGYALELARQAPHPEQMSIALVRRANVSSDRFMRRAADPEQFWRSLAALQFLPRVDGVWVIGSGLERRDFPNSLRVADTIGDRPLDCRLQGDTMRDSDERGRVPVVSWAGRFFGFQPGVPYALYGCRAGSSAGQTSRAPSSAGFLHEHQAALAIR